MNMSVNGIVDGIEDYLEPGDDPGSVQRFGTVCDVTQGILHLLTFLTTDASSKFANLSKKVEPFQKYSEYLSPVSFVNNLIKGNYISALSSVGGAAEVANLIDTNTGKYFLNKDWEVIKSYTGSISCLAAFYLDYQGLPSFKEVKELGARLYKDLTLLSKSTLNEVEKGLQSNLLKNCHNLCEVVGPILLFPFSFIPIQNLGLQYGAEFFGAALAKKSDGSPGELELPSSWTVGLACAAGIFDISAHILSKYIESPSWAEPLKKSLQSSFEGKGLNFNRQFSHEEMKELFYSAKVSIEKSGETLDYQRHCDEVAEVLAESVKTQIIKEIRKNPQNEKAILDGEDKSIHSIHKTIQKFTEAFISKSIKSERRNKRFMLDHYEEVEALVSSQFSKVLRETVHKVKEEGIPKIYKPVTQKVSETTGSLTKVKQLAKILRLFLCFGEEALGYTSLRSWTDGIAKNIKPMDIFQMPIAVVKPLMKLKWSNLSSDLRENVLNMSKSANALIFKGEAALSLLGYASLSRYLKQNAVKNLGYSFGMVAALSDTYDLLSGKEVEVKGVKKHVNGILEDWYEGKELKEIMTEERVFKVVALTAKLSLIFLSCATVNMGYLPSKTFKLSLEVAQFVPSLVADLYKDVPNPKASAA